jgi:hypothetical protein
MIGVLRRSAEAQRAERLHAGEVAEHATARSREWLVDLEVMAVVVSESRRVSPVRLLRALLNDSHARLWRVMLAETPDCGRVALMKHFRPANLEE